MRGKGKGETREGGDRDGGKERWDGGRGSAEGTGGAGGGVQDGFYVVAACGGVEEAVREFSEEVCGLRGVWGRGEGWAREGCGYVWWDGGGVYDEENGDVAAAWGD